MRILVFSDSHKNVAVCERVINNIIGVDMIIHAGDHASDAMELSRLFPDIPVKLVAGNCDFTKAPQELLVEAEGKRIFVTHGHGYRVKNEESYTTLREKAGEIGCDCVVFGHTHEPVCDFSRKIPLLNPGSIKYGGSYGVIEIEDGKLRACICGA